jgi:hypothetical protein
VREAAVLLGLLGGVARLLAAHATSEVHLVHRHVGVEPLVLDAERRGQRVQRGLDEVRHRELRQRAAHRHVGRDEDQARTLEQRDLARDAEVVRQVGLDQRGSKPAAFRWSSPSTPNSAWGIGPNGVEITAAGLPVA